MTFHAPHSFPFIGLELVFVACFALTVAHAVRRYRHGDRYAVFQWLVAFAYGICMELVAFNFLDNYTHAQFSVQLYHDKLPLYVVCLYPVFLYTGLQIVQRLKLSAVAEALLVGFAICLIDIPFDLAGVDAGWWVWSTTDKNLAVRWLDVPVTSYYWYLLFGAVYALLSRSLRRTVEKRPLAVMILLAPFVGGAVIFFGAISFLPFHALQALGVRDDIVVAGHLAGCALLAVTVRLPAKATKPMSSLWPIAVLLAAFNLLVLGLYGHRTKIAFAAVAVLALYRLVSPTRSEPR